MLTRCSILMFALCACSCSNGQSRRVDDPVTTNDERNDQPLGSMGTTLCVMTTHNGRKYTLDVDVDDAGRVREIYFPKGGNVDFDDCTIDADMTGACDDENGREWEFMGEEC